MHRLSLLMALCLVAASAGCGSEEPKTQEGTPDAAVVGEANCVNEKDDDADGQTDCYDTDCASDIACRPPEPKPCRVQSDCGDRVANVAVPVCLEGKCVAPGPFDPKTGEALVTDVNFSIIFDKTYAMATQPPETVVLRFIHPKRLDGTALTCAQVKALNGSTNETKHQLDNNATINQIYRTIFKVSWGASSAGDYVLPTVVTQFVPKGKGYIMYAEAWYGPRAQNDPTGNRATVACLENVDLEVASPKVSFAFRP